MTMQDKIIIAVITVAATFLTNLIFHYLKNKLDLFEDKRKFKREHSYNQLKELYLELYGIVSQSEYVRYFEKRHSGQETPFEEYPFIELTSKRVKEVRNLITNRVTKRTEEVIHNAITDFNKLAIAEKIIDKKEFSTQKLLKLAVAYRFCHEYSQFDWEDEERKQAFEKEEVELIANIVKTVIKECNQMLETCHLDYDSKELGNGFMDYSFLNRKD
ncbi:hypothetical protein M3221_13635 [Domibacillus indicus]|uniref:hypothetical protein n=1 Tax=Domibacillus indicus TaxID=1437523 RepID=UPI002040FBF4|nr:hypothetical protein [Domibacillus indicus]MCM3789442.1 hypothetical protein [Domibacillus indicus]